jgi:hypothetical protein
MKDDISTGTTERGEHSRDSWDGSSDNSHWYHRGDISRGNFRPHGRGGGGRWSARGGSRDVGFEGRPGRWDEYNGGRLHRGGYRGGGFRGEGREGFRGTGVGGYRGGEREPYRGGGGRGGYRGGGRGRY